MRYGLYSVLTFALFALWLPISTVKSFDEEQVRLRFAQFSPDAGSIDIFVNDEQVPTQLQFGAISEWFAFSETEMLTIVFRSTSDNPIAIELDISLESANQDWATVALIGLSATDTLALQSFSEDRGENLPGEGRFAFFHAVQGVGSLDILLNDTVLFQLVGYPDVTSILEDNDGYVYVDVVSSDYEVRIQENLSSQTVIDPFQLSVLPDRSYFLALIGTTENPEIIVTSDSLNQTEIVVENPVVESSGGGEPSYVRIGHFSSGTGDLDFYIDGERLNNTPVSFTGVGSFVELSPGEHTLSVKLANQPDSISIVPDAQISFVAGSWTTIATVGLMDNGSLDVRVLDEDFSPINAGDVRLTIFHAVPGIGALDVIANDLPLVSLLGYPGSQGDNDGLATVDLLAGIYAIRVVNSANEEDIFIDLGEINLAEGNHFMLALIRANPPFVFTYVPTN